MTTSALLKYDPIAHAEEYGWIWTEDYDGEPCWHMMFTIEDGGIPFVCFFASDNVVFASTYAGQPFVLVDEPPFDGTDAPGAAMASGRIQ